MYVYKSINHCKVAYALGETVNKSMLLNLKKDIAQLQTNALCLWGL